MCIARRTLSIATTALVMGLAAAAQAEEVEVALHQVTPEGTGKEAGTVQFRDHDHELLVVPELRGLTPGPHGAHIHENPDCRPATHDGETVPGGAARGHFDPQGTGRHEGPYGGGHLGDLPVLIVEKDGSAGVPCSRRASRSPTSSAAR